VLRQYTGGTVDITSHQLSDDGVSISEFMAPTGGNWGSNCINDAYVRLLENIISPEVLAEFRRTEPSAFRTSVNAKAHQYVCYIIVVYHVCISLFLSVYPFLHDFFRRAVDICDKFEAKKHQRPNSDKVIVELNQDLTAFMSGKHLDLGQLVKNFAEPVGERVHELTLERGKHCAVAARIPIPHLCNMICMCVGSLCRLLPLSSSRAVFQASNSDLVWHSGRVCSPRPSNA
jgi:hypothetical protein